MSDKVLFVDDDQKILNGVSRQFEDVLEFETALSPQKALELIDFGGSYAVVVSDMRMPEMSGIELLLQVKERSPDTVRIMLTGYADLQATIEAVNDGNIFRFLSKPCPQGVLEKAVRDGLAQHRLVTSERELLDGTLHGSIKVLSEVLSLVNPLAFGRASHVQRIALAIGEEMQLSNLWDLKIAALLFPLGCVTVSENTLECALAGRPIPEPEKAVFAQHAAVASDILSNIPRLEAVSSIVAYQDKGFDGSGNPEDDVCGNEIPTGARVLKVASDFEIAYRKSGDTSVALQELNECVYLYDPNIFDSLCNVLRKGLCRTSRREVSIQELTEAMVLASDVRTARGQLMVTRGQEMTHSVRRRLRELCEKEVIQSTFLVELLGDVVAFDLETL